MWIDSHAHLDTFVADGSWSEIRSRMQTAQVSSVIAIGGSVAANELALATAREHGEVHAVIGYDRDEAERAPDFGLLRDLVNAERPVGIGETGLDYFYGKDTASQQRALFERNLSVAAEFGLPVVVHTREAKEDTYQLLREYVSERTRRRAASGDSDTVTRLAASEDNSVAPKIGRANRLGELNGDVRSNTVPGVIHCYTGDADQALKLLELGFMISFSGIVTFKKSDALRTVLKVIPDDRLLIETDAPYLAPVPKRGKQNEPAFVSYVGEGIAQYLDRPIDEMAMLTSRNARRLFNLPEPT